MRTRSGGAGAGSSPRLMRAMAAPGLLARLLGGELAVASERDPPDAGRSPALRDVYLPPGRVDPHAEAGELAVPEDGLLFRDGKPVDGTLWRSSVRSASASGSPWLLLGLHGDGGDAFIGRRRAARHRAAHRSAVGSGVDATRRPNFRRLRLALEAPSCRNHCVSHRHRTPAYWSVGRVILSTGSSAG